MNTRKIIKVEVFRQEKYDGEWPPENAAECLAWFDTKIASIPEEYRASAKVKIDSVERYENSSYATLEITYKRPETDAEWASRVAANDARERQLAERERAEFDRLRDKFGSLDKMKPSTSPKMWKPSMACCPNDQTQQPHRA